MRLVLVLVAGAGVWTLAYVVAGIAGVVVLLIACVVVLGLAYHGAGSPRI